jgi:mRNA-degrading endonuclease RelE of RelBE toxin-antitoxin system
MPYEIILAPEAAEDLRSLRVVDRSAIKQAMQEHLRHEPQRMSKSRIKRLRGLRKPQYRLRVGEVRVFYDVTGTRVEVLAIITKANADQWLAQHGVTL